MSFHRFALVASLASVSSLVGACSAPSEDVDQTEGAQTGAPTVKGGGTAALPIQPWLDDQTINKSAVLAAWRKMRDAYYVSGDGIVRTNPAGATVPLWPANKPLPETEPLSCLGNDRPYYSDLMLHFYCWHPAYSNVPDTTRGCFSALAGGVPNGGTFAAAYPLIYDYCLYQPYDYIVPTKPVFNAQTIKDNKALGAPGKVGSLQWVSNNEEDVFKYVAFTWYNPFAFKLVDQQDVINEYYGVKLTKKDYTATDAADVAACNGTAGVLGGYDRPGGGRPRRQSDPTDGTHCSTNKVRSITLAKKDETNLNRFMQELAAGKEAVDIR